VTVPDPGEPESTASDPASQEAAASASGLRAEDLGTQSLFRVQYQGLEGSGALRLVLRIGSPERYSIETKDRFGRGLWRIEGAPGAHRLVDDRRKVYCISEEGIRIPEIALEALPLGDLPAILFDRLPGGLEPAAGAGEYRDRQGRRWTVTLADDEPTAWTFWEAGEPRIWWLREAAGEARLSHRAGTQLRWKRVAVEPLPGELDPVVVEESYEQIPCDSWPRVAADGQQP
jgi:hypothetical protein